MGEAWRIHDLGTFQRLLFFDLEAGPDGRIKDRHGWPEQWEALRERARVARVPLDPVVSVIGRPAFATIFANAEARARLAAEIVEVARGSGGVHLDVEVFEPVAEPELDGFRVFLAELRRSLDAPQRRFLSAFVPISGNLYGARELALLDVVVAQGYDVHWQTAPSTGPVALLDGSLPGAWRATARALAEQGVSPRRIVFSTPLYGYEWPTVSAEPRAATRGAGAIITYAPLPSALLPDLRVSALARAAEHGLRRESSSGAAWYAFRDREGWRQGWFDDPVSLAPRLRFIRDQDYRGVALFVLGYDGGALLETIEAAFRAGSARSADARPPPAR
jgi:spore germination protein YaaH